MTKVSFIVPTLNRRHYVVRAVASCLVAGEAVSGVETEVVVLDSQSDDGSWELLQDRFGTDPRVKLVQNQRGLGPTHSWIDGVDCATGDYMTFVWSDDYISPRFLTRLLPMMNVETHVAIGVGIMRDVDEETPFPTDDSHHLADPSDYIAGYFPPFEGKTPNFFSPICALFSRKSFHIWKNTATNWGHATPLREEIFWRRAIGPDLMLYFSAALVSRKIAFTHEPVAQFSAHPESISISVSKYLLWSGYWLTKCWIVRDAGLRDLETKHRLLRMRAETILLGWTLRRKIPANSIKLNIIDARRQISQECALLWRSMTTDFPLSSCLRVMSALVLMQLVPRRIRKALMKRRQARNL